MTYQDLKGKKVSVTGSSSGIGPATTVMFSRQGFNFYYWRICRRQRRIVYESLRTAFAVAGSLRQG